MQKARRHPFPLRGIGLRQLVGTWFQVLLTPLIGVLFIVQSPYLSTIGRDGVLSLGEWAPQFHTGFHGHRATLERQPQRRARDVAYGTITLSREPFQTLRLPLPLSLQDWRPQPPPFGGFGLVRVRSPLLTESRLISFPTGTEMFQFPAFAPPGLCIQPGVTPSACTVATGCPIRRSQDQSSFDSSPGLIAACRVLHRLITPRHPPCTLSSLITSVVGPLWEKGRAERQAALALSR
jgi:hypothetical protein